MGSRDREEGLDSPRLVWEECAQGGPSPVQSEGEDEDQDGEGLARRPAGEDEDQDGKDWH